MKKIFIFSILIAILYSITTLIFYLQGYSIGANENLTSTLSLLMLTGLFLGAKSYKQDLGDIHFGFGKAYVVILKMLFLSSFVYSVFIFSLYSIDSELFIQYKESVVEIFKAYYKGSPMLEPLLGVMDNVFSPGLVAFSEFFNKMFSGALFAIFLSLLIRSRDMGPLRMSGSNE